MLAVVPAERGDAVAGLEPEVPEGPGESAGAFGKGRVFVTMDRGIGETGDDFLADGHRFRTAEDGVDRQRVVHHQALHGADFIVVSRESLVAGRGVASRGSSVAWSHVLSLVARAR